MEFYKLIIKTLDTRILMNNISRMPQEGPEIIKQRQSFIQEIQLAPILDMSKFAAVVPAAPAAATAVIDK